MAQPFPALPPMRPDLVFDVGQVLGWFLLVIGWFLSLSPSWVFYLGYMIFGVWLTRWVLRHVRPVFADQRQFSAQYPGNVALPNGAGFVRGLAILTATAFGAGLPYSLAPLWKDPQVWGAQDALGIMGRLAIIVGGICGFLIGSVCDFHLIAIFVLGMAGYLVWHILLWIFGG